MRRHRRGRGAATLYAQVRAQYGHIDVLFNNAGISPNDDASVLETSYEAWQRVQDVNLKSVFFCCKYGIAHLLENERGGSVINTASFVAVMGAATSQISYTASKGGVLAMSRELGVEFARRGVRVNALCPGPVDTPLLRELFAKDPEKAARRLVHVPMGRFARARGDRRRRAVPGQRRVVVRHGLDVPRRRRAQRGLRHARVRRLSSPSIRLNRRSAGCRTLVACLSRKRCLPVASPSPSPSGGGATIAHELLDNPSTATGSTPTASTRPISNTTPSRIYDGAKDAVTYIVADTAQGQATGSGFVISKDGLIVTNDHVVEGATRVQVKVGTSGKAQDATVVGADPSRDLALLKVDGSNLSTLSLGDSSSVGVGDAVYAIGNPFGLDHTFTTGIVSALSADLQAPDGATISGAIQTDAALNPGNSGGPLLDSAGQVIGVNAQIETGQQNGAEGGNVGIGFAIPSSTVKAFVQEAKDGKLAPQQSQDQQQPDPYGFGIG